MQFYFVFSQANRLTQSFMSSSCAAVCNPNHCRSPSIFELFNTTVAPQAANTNHAFSDGAHGQDTTSLPPRNNTGSTAHKCNFRHAHKLRRRLSRSGSPILSTVSPRIPQAARSYDPAPLAAVAASFHLPCIQLPGTPQVCCSSPSTRNPAGGRRETAKWFLVSSGGQVHPEHLEDLGSPSR